MFNCPGGWASVPSDLTVTGVVYSVGSKGFRVWQKTDEMTKTGRGDENIDFWQNWMKLAKFGICGKILNEICSFGPTKNGILVAKSGGDVEKALSQSLTMWHSRI